MQVFPNLRVEMARKNIKILDLADKTGIGYQTLTLKLKGDSDFKLSEAIAVKAALESKLTLEELFSDTLIEAYR